MLGSLADGFPLLLWSQVYGRSAAARSRWSPFARPSLGGLRPVEIELRPSAAAVHPIESVILNCLFLRWRELLCRYLARAAKQHPEEQICDLSHFRARPAPDIDDDRVRGKHRCATHWTRGLIALAARWRCRRCPGKVICREAVWRECTFWRPAGRLRVEARATPPPAIVPARS